jgi:hypothetical protein
MSFVVCSTFEFKHADVHFFQRQQITIQSVTAASTTLSLNAASKHKNDNVFHLYRYKFNTIAYTKFYLLQQPIL